MPKVKNLKKAAKRIKEAIKKKENIVLFSDADLDGVASLIVLEETIQSLGGQIQARYFPNREKQGYGLSDAILDEIKPLGGGVLILSDSGIASFEPIDKAKKLGFSVIVVDHHEILEKLPKADIIIDPKQASDDYPFKLMAACGLCFRLAEELLEGQPALSLKQSFLELVALGTIADMVPVTDDNQFFIEQGLVSLSKSLRPGLKTLRAFFNGSALSSRELASKIISVLQLTDFQGHLTESYLFLRANEQKETEELAKFLIEKSLARRDLVKELVREIKEEIPNNLGIIFQGGEQVPHLLTGNIASKLCNYFKKPCFVYSSKKDISRGSLRAPRPTNGLDGLRKCQDLLEVYGGHPQAAGFTVKNENLGKLKECLEKHFSN